MVGASLGRIKQALGEGVLGFSDRREPRRGLFGRIHQAGAEVAGKDFLRLALALRVPCASRKILTAVDSPCGLKQDSLIFLRCSASLNPQEILARHFSPGLMSARSCQARLQ